MSAKKGICIIGCGNRGSYVGGNFLKVASDRIEIRCVYDPNPEAVANAKKVWNTPDIYVASSMEEAVNRPDIELVGIFTPNVYHCPTILAALAAGKQVFSEKPLATTLEDCQKVIEAEKKANIDIFTGFVLRYSPIYRKVKELLSSGSFGKVINISANENRESYGGGNSMSADYGWRRFRSQAGPYLLEKCSHDLDLLNWFIDSVPSRVASFCSLNYFVEENAALWDKLGHDVYAKHVPEAHRINPFLSDKDIYDNHTVIMDYPNGVKANFQLTLANAITERRMYISCTEGNIIVESASGILRYKHYTDDYETMLTFTGGEHAGGDIIMAAEVIDAWLSGKKPETSGSVNGLACARVALAADLSAQTGKIMEV